MALKDCPECSAKVSDKAPSCPSCGFPVAAQASYSIAPLLVRTTKSRGIYIILGLIAGAMGYHNFYAGHNVSGGVKVGIVLAALILDKFSGSGFGITLFFMGALEIWALIEIIVTKKDATGIPMT